MPPVPLIASCLLQFAGMTCADSASWAQAVGTFLAVSASAGVAFWLHLRESARHRQADEARVKKAAALCIMVAAAVRAAIHQMHDAANDKDAGALDGARAVLADTVSLPFPDGFEALPEGVSVSFLELRRVGVQALAGPHDMERFHGEGIAAGLGMLRTEVEERAAAFADALRIIGIEPNDRVR